MANGQDATVSVGDPNRFDVGTVRPQFPLLRETGIHYLDSAATSQMPDAVLAALHDFETRSRANVHGGVHRLSRAAIEAYEDARAAVADFLNVPSPGEVVFTYGTTSAINLAAHSFGALLDQGDEVVVSVLEHHSNLIPWQMLRERRGIVLRVLPMTPDGQLDLDRLDEVVTDRCRLIALTHCSNVTGAITDVPPVVAAARAVGARVFLDGAQRVPHGPVDIRSLGIDCYAFSGHKMFGPTGIGVFWAREELLRRMPPFMGGGQMIRRVTLERATYADPPRRFEAGTPPIAGAVGLGAAARWLGSLDWAGGMSHELRLTGRLIDGLSRIPGLRLIGSEELHRRRGVISFVMDGIAPMEICRILDRHDVALRCGHHCAQPLHDAFGIAESARASIAIYNDDTDVDAFLTGIEDVAKGAR